ncbi:MAG: hypothetical protein JW840_08065 [Candidatus Thermoplasmatota archaeon]|nr:hypothetical protein [Candidatus Thermoplasmatota archaeon]
MMKKIGIYKGVFLLGILFIVISASVLIFGYRIRELWPATVWMYDIGIPTLLGMAGVTFFSVSNVIFFYVKSKKEHS